MTRRRSPIALLMALVGVTCCIGLGLWVTRGTPPPLDAAARVDASPTSALGQIAAGIGIALWPGVVCAGLLVAAWQLWTRRLRQLAIAHLAAVGLTWGLATPLKLWIGRPRPDGAPDLITTIGPGYPSIHVAMATTACVLVGATVVVSRQRAPIVRAALGASIAVVLLVAWARWWIDAHWLTDIIGGMALGAAAAVGGLWAANVHIVEEMRPRPRGSGQRRAAVIVNPAKVGDLASLRRHTEFELRERGWDLPMWLETAPDEAGRGLAQRAIDADVDLVLVAGGDGTTRVVCGALAHSGIPVALVPAGTTNLLARNLGVPLDESAALDVAFDGARRHVDLIRFVPDSDEEQVEYSAVIGGIGLDGGAFAHTDETLKRTIGAGAYVVAAAQQWGQGDRTMHARVTIDDDTSEVEAATIMIGNVGVIPGGVEVIRDADPSDGLLDVMVATPESLGAWARLLGDVLTNRGERAQVQQHTGRTVTVELDAERPFQLDGDAIGSFSRIEATVCPGALMVMLPERREE